MSTPGAEEFNYAAMSTLYSGIEQATLWLVYSSVVYFIVEQGLAFYKFYMYSVPIPSWENEGKWTYFLMKMALIVCLMIGFALPIFYPSAAVLKGLETWAQLLIFLPILLLKTWTELNYRLSTGDPSFLSIKAETLHMVFGSVRETVLIGGGVTGLAYGTRAAGSELGPSMSWAGLGLSIHRCCSVLGLLYVTWALNQREEPALSPEAETTHEAAAAEDAGDEDEDEGRLGPYELCAQFYAFRTYLIPTEPLPRLYFFIILGLIGVGSFVDLYSNIIYRRILDSLHINEASNKSVSTGALPTGFIRPDYRWDYLLIYTVLQFGHDNIIQNLRYYLKKKIERSCSGKLQMDIFAKLHQLSLRWHLENKSLEVFSLMSYAPYILAHILTDITWLLPQCLGMAVTLVYLLSYYSLKLSAIVIATAAVSTALDMLILRWHERALREIYEAESDTRSAREASFENYETVKYFTNEAYEQELYEKAYQREMAEDDRVNWRHDLTSVLRQLLQSVAELGILLIVVRNIVWGEGLQPGDYIYFSGIFSKVMDPVEAVFQFYEDLQGNALSLKKLNKVLTLVPEITDEPNAPPLDLAGAGTAIEFRNVDFSYMADREILKNVNFVVPAGQTVALVGHSGSGKSTIGKLLFRFYDPTAGEILVNGQNIRKVQCYSLRRLIGVVPQDIVLFDDTIMNNIKYGNVLKATDEDVIEAAKLACLHERIESFPNKYETEVGSRGLKLSGGEKQRVAIARTLVKDPPIILLDEATSSLDTETERQIQSSFDALSRNRTCLIIAHRLSTIVHADMIIVLRDGEVIESGTHEELLVKEDGAYASMWQQQFSPEPLPSRATTAYVTKINSEEELSDDDDTEDLNED